MSVQSSSLQKPSKKVAKQASPKLQPFLQQVNEAIALAKAEGIVATPGLVRQGLDNLAQFTSAIPDIAYQSGKRIVVGGSAIPVRVYSPAPQEALPVMIYFHGGGHMCGSVALYEPMCRKLALAAHCVVISVEYRLAPEFPYPAGLDDCYRAVINYKQVLSEISFGEELILGGDSAGGALTTSLTMRSQSDPQLRFDKQVLIYPSVDYTGSLPSVEANGIGFLLEKTKIDWYFENYFQASEDRQAASPLFAPLDTRPVPTLVITAGLDPLHDEGVAYYEKVKQTGVYAEHHEFADMIHAFMNLEDLVVEECQRLYQVIGDFVKRP